ncbi:hypothetical protein Pcinc_002592 [Petrolisthes cinctipes]|nr:hypothetical protein Pcinc_002592 [Petrolisthes cinctipes]
MWSQVTGGPDIRVDTALLYSLGSLLEVHPKVPTSATSGQVMVGWWLVYCLVIYTGFESELISHLTVNKGRTRPPETLEDLVNADGWKWGIDAWIWTGVPLEYFTRHKDKVVVEIYKKLEVIEAHKGLKKILRNGYSLLAVTNYITVEASSYYGDGHGNIPFFITKKSVTMFSFFAWGFRLGAPFYHRFNRMTQQLDAAGIITLWVNQVINQRIKDNRHIAELTGGIYYGDKSESEDGHVVLGLDHLQGAFYLLFLGAIVCLLGLLVEILIHSSFECVTDKMIL